METKERKRGLWSKRGIIVIIAMLGCLSLCSCSGGVPEDRVKEDVLASSFVADGFIPSTYVNESKYELTEFKIDSQREDKNREYGIEKAQIVKFSGKIKNDSFESSFTGTACFAKSGDSWQTIGKAGSDSYDTIPLKGVDLITDENASGENSNIIHSDFSCSFDDSNEQYTASASETVTCELWFADDTAKNTQDFIFDNQKGWMPKGETKASDLSTTYKLAGKTFNFIGDEGYGSLVNAVGSGEASLEFKEITFNLLIFFQ